MISMVSKEARKQANKQKGKQAKRKTSKKANKRKSKQKVVSAGEKCWFGSNVHSFIVLKHR